MNALKSNADILAEQEAFHAAYLRACQALDGVENVVGVGMGLKQVSGAFSDDIAILVFVTEKKAERDLPADARVPSDFDGYRTDVRVVQNVQPGTCDNTARFPTIQGGIQITTKIVTTPAGPAFFPGTLGTIVRKRADAGRENVYFLSCKHVLHALNSGVNDSIYQPVPPTVDHKTTTLGPVMPGGVFANVPFKFSAAAPPVQVFLDCAFGRLDIDSTCCGSTCTKDTQEYDVTILDLQVKGVNTVSDVNNILGNAAMIGKPVFKVGRTTGKTAGKITAIAASFPTGGDITVAGSPAFTAQTTIEIAFDRGPASTGVNCHAHAWFAETGDSGSLVVDENGAAVGMITFVPTGPAPIDALSYACHIVPVLDQLGICIPCTTGTSHGSSRATDGSGIAPGTQTTALEDLPTDGTIVFTGADGEGSALVPGALPALMQLTDDEVEVMQRRLTALRATPRGRALHDAFGHLRREVGYLIRNSRPVTVAWHRGKGPAFMTHVLNHLAGHTDRMPHEVHGVTRHELLARMRDVLDARGSNPLREALVYYGDDLIAAASDSDCHTIEDCIALLQQQERV
jgi:hypothetical protein